MFRVDYRYTGQGLWNMPALPVSLQAAIGQARAKAGGLVADEVRLVPTAQNSAVAKPAANAVNLLV